MLDKIIEVIENIFAARWVATAVGAGGVLLCFGIFLAVGLLAGDFINNRRALLTLSKGEIENGLKMLKGFAPAYDKSREISPPVSAFDYDKILGFPYSYSMIKKLPSVTLAATAFFTVLAGAASIIQEGKLTHYTCFLLMFVPFIGLALYITALLVAATMLKGAVNRYHKSTELIKDINVRPAGEVIAEEEYVPQEIQDICNRIEVIATGGGANYEELNSLYTKITRQKEKNPDGEAAERLSAALDVLSALIDSAL